MLPNLNGYFISRHGCFCGSSQLLTSHGNQEGAIRAGVLDGRSHKPVDKLLHDHLAGECLRNLDHRCEIEMFDWRFDRIGRTCRALGAPQPRMELLEVAHLCICAPAQVAVPCAFEVEMCDVFEATRCVEARSQLVGEGLVMDKF